jgi:hypothetical protein
MSKGMIALVPSQVALVPRAFNSKGSVRLTSKFDPPAITKLGDANWDTETIKVCDDALCPKKFSNVRVK